MADQRFEWLCERRIDDFTRISIDQVNGRWLEQAYQRWQRDDLRH